MYKLRKTLTNITLLFFILMFRYFKSLIKTGTGDSSKSFGLVLSVIIGAIIGISVVVIFLYDGLLDGKIDTELDGLGWFLLSAGAFMFGGGLNKTISEMKERGSNRPEDVDV